MSRSRVRTCGQFAEEVDVFVINGVPKAIPRPRTILSGNGS